MHFHGGQGIIYVVITLTTVNRRRFEVPIRWLCITGHQDSEVHSPRRRDQNPFGTEKDSSIPLESGK